MSSRQKALALTKRAIASIKDAKECLEDLPSGVLPSHLRLLEAELEEIRERLTDNECDRYLPRGDSVRVITDQWPLVDYELTRDVVAAFHAARRILHRN